MTAIVLRGDARALPLPDATVDLIVTSPPYFGLRSYTDGGARYAGQIGSEATPQEWVAALVECTREWMRVLKPSGSMFVNLGDKFSSGAGPHTGKKSDALMSTQHGHGGGPKWVTTPRQAPVEGFREKSLLGLPWRYALAATDQLGLILRRDIIWAKPNGLPESVTDRCRSSHEYLFHLVKQPRYYAAVDEIREPHHDQARPNGQRSPRDRISPGGKRMDSGEGATHRTFNKDADHLNPLGKLPGSVWRMPEDDTVWDIPSQPLTVPAHLGVDHFAAFPMELPRRCVLGWSPPGVCVACGEGRRPVTSTDRPLAQTGRIARLTASQVNRAAMDGGTTSTSFGVDASALNRRITGYVCACGETPGEWQQAIPAHPSRPSRPTARSRDDHPNHPPGLQSLPPTRPAVVLDPFGGTGTTALVASMLGRTGVSIDRSADYTRLARWRTQDPAERAKALQVPKPPPVSTGQDALFAI